MREGAPDGANRSDTFHAIVGHYLGCGWSVEQIVAQFEQHSDGIGGRYLAEGRLAGEVERSAKKYRPLEQRPELWSTDWKQESEPHKREPEPEPEPESEEPEPELEEDAGAEPELPPMFAHGDLDRGRSNDGPFES